jgi:hypothetical protein
MASATHIGHRRAQGRDGRPRRRREPEKEQLDEKYPLCHVPCRCGPMDRREPVDDLPADPERRDPHRQSGPADDPAHPPPRGIRRRTKHEPPQTSPGPCHGGHRDALTRSGLPRSIRNRSAQADGLLNGPGSVPHRRPFAGNGGRRPFLRHSAMRLRTVDAEQNNLSAISPEILE